MVLEVNPRYCASMELVERASGASVFALHRAACEGELPDRPVETSGAWGKAIVYAARTVAVPDTVPWLAQGVRDVPHPGEVIRAGHPICTVFARGDTRAPCEDGLRSEAARIQGRLRADPRRRCGGGRRDRRVVAWSGDSGRRRPGGQRERPAASHAFTTCRWTPRRSMPISTTSPGWR